MGEYSLPKGISCLNIYSLKINELIQSPEAGVHFFSTIGVVREGGGDGSARPTPGRFCAHPRISKGRQKVSMWLLKNAPKLSKF